MVVLEGEAGDEKEVPTERPDKSEEKAPTLLSLESILFKHVDIEIAGTWKENFIIP